MPLTLLEVKDAIMALDTPSDILWQALNAAFVARIRHLMDTRHGPGVTVCGVLLPEFSVPECVAILAEALATAGATGARTGSETQMLLIMQEAVEIYFKAHRERVQTLVEAIERGEITIPL